MASPSIPNTDLDRAEMLRTIGVADVEALLTDIPHVVRNPALRLPLPSPEVELSSELAELAGTNRVAGLHPSFLGGGAYRHWVPAVVRHIVARNEFVTAYTPYQAEISQGTLQSIYEFQTLVSQLAAMDVSNAGIYDGASALAEATLMACRVTQRSRVSLAAGVNPRLEEVARTYAQALDIAFEHAALGAPPAFPGLETGDCAALVVQYPNFYGIVDDLAGAARAAHEAGALLIVVADPVALGLFRPPGELGADIVVAEGQALGNALGFGGPYVGLFSCRREYLRQMPGRLVSRTTDLAGQVGYVMTLQTREQHIRRERATSNICTNDALVALATTAHLAALGPAGLRRVAELCYHKAHYAAARIAQLPDYALPLEGAFFKEFVVECPRLPVTINRSLLEQGIIGGIDVSPTVRNGLLLCVTELTTRDEIDRLVAALAEIARER